MDLFNTRTLYLESHTAEKNLMLGSIFPGRSRWAFLILSVLLMGASAFASPSSLTYQGRILKTDGTSLEYNNVSFIFQVMNAAGTCLVYQEQVTGYNMVNSGGVFDVPIGQGTVQYPLGGASDVLNAFNNSTTFTCGSCSLSGGSYICVDGSSTYAASAGDERKLRVQFYDGSGWKTISPDSVIRSVPFAGYSLSAQKLGTNIASDFVLKTGIPTCSSGSFLTWDGTQLNCTGVSGASGGTVTSVTSMNGYISIVNGTSTPQVTLNVGTAANTVAAGNDTRLVNAMQSGSIAGGDLSGTYPNPSVVQIHGTAVSNTTPASGQFFKFNGTSWTPAVIATADVSGLSASLGSYLTQSAFNGYVTSAACSASQTLYWNSVSSNFQCQAINVGLAGDVTGSIGASKVVALQNNPVDTTTPTSNQVLQWNGTKWAPATLPAGNAGTVTSVSGTAPISVATGSSTPVVSIAQSNSTTSGYLSSTDWNTFNGKQSAGNYISALTGDVTAAGPGSAAAAVVKIQGTAVSATSPTSAGQMLRYNGSSWAPNFVSMFDLRSTITGSQAFSGVGCTPGQTLTWTAATDNLSCSTIAITGSQVTYASQTANTFFAAPNGSSGAPTFRTLAAGDLPAGTLSGSGTAGYLPYYSSASALANSPLFTTGTNVGVGIVTPAATFDVSDSNTSDTPGSAHKFRMSAGTTGLFGFRMSNSAANRYLVFDKNWTGWQPAYSIDRQNGYFGIATASPLAGLDLAGDLSQPGNYLMASNIYWDNTALNYKFRANGMGGMIKLADTTYPGMTFNVFGTNASGAGVVATRSVAMLISDTGNIGVGTNSPTVSLDLGSKTDALRLPNGTTAQQPATPANGMIRYNSTNNLAEVYQNGAWVNLTTSAGGSNVTTNSSGAVTVAAGGTNQNVTLQSSGTGVVTSPSIMTLTSTQASTSSSSGALVVSGGVGVSGNINAGGNLSVGGAVSSTGYHAAQGVPNNADSSTNGFSFTPDGDTGIFSPGTGSANGVLSFYSNNSEVMRVATGSVAIGTTTPAAKFHVVGGSVRSEGNGNGTAAFEAYSSAGTVYYQIYNGSAAADQKIFRMGNRSGRFFLDSVNDAYSSSVEAVSVLPSGNVGIKATAPISLLQIGSSALSMPSWTTQGPNFYIPGTTITDTTGSGAFTDKVAASMGTPTFAATTAETITNATTFYISGAPSAGTNVTITNPLAFQVGAGTSFFNGNVGVGTAAPVSQFEVSTGTSNDSIISTRYNTVGQFGGSMIFRRAQGTAAAPSALLVNDTIGGIYGRGYGATGWSGNNTGAIRFNAAEAFTNTAQGTSIDFAVTPLGSTTRAVAMTLSASGALGIGTTTPEVPLDVRNYMQVKAPASNYEAGIMLSSNGVSTKDLRYTIRTSPDAGKQGRFEIIRFSPTAGTEIDRTAYNNDGTWSFPGGIGIGGGIIPTYLLQLSADSAAKPGSSTWTIASDRRLKDIRAPYTRGLDALLGIHPIYFKYKKDNPLGLPSDKEYVGIIAQDAKKAVPEAVDTDKQGYFHVTNDAIIWAMFNGIKELYAKMLNHHQSVDRMIASVQAENIELKARLENEKAAKDKEVAELKARLDRLEKALEAK